MSSVTGGEIPDYLRPVIVEEPDSTAQAVAERAVLALNESMMQHYEVSLNKFKGNLRDKSPILLAMFTGQGGQMVLYRPGREPEAAPSVPLTYQLFKSVGHSTLAIYEILVPYLSNASGNQLWRPTLDTYLTQNRIALQGLDSLDVAADKRDILRQILELNIEFMEQCLSRGGFTLEDIEGYVRSTVQHSFKAIGIASGTQVAHWMGVVERWQGELGADWERTYAVSNTLYIARQNNILFSVLAQFMGVEAIGDRLLLVETPEFETTPEKLLDVLTRIVADRSLGMMFFRDYYLMDVELLGGGARAAIEREMEKRGRTAVLPPLAPFRSNDWPWKTDPQKGTGPARLEEAAFDDPRQSYPQP